jgi:hypothetical protein
LGRLAAFVVEKRGVFAIKTLKPQPTRRHVNELEFSMQRHIHTHINPTYFNILDVEKNPNATSKRAPNQTLIVKCNFSLKRSCGTVGIPTCHREKKTISEFELLAEQRCNQLQPNTNAVTKSGASAKFLRRSCYKRGPQQLLK